MEIWIIIAILCLMIFIRTKKRGYFWKDKTGNKLTFKQFTTRWKKGVEGITPIQQTITTLWSYPLVVGGILTGLIITIIRGEYWLTLILGGSLPMTLMSLLSTWQKYKQQKRINEAMKQANEQITQ